MTEADQTQTQTPTDDGRPWGSDEDFQPDKAWTLIQNLRNEVAEAKSKGQSQVAAKDQELETLRASLQQATDSVADKEAELASVNALRTKENLLLAAGVPVEFAANITGDDEEAWKADVGRLAALRGATTGDPQQKTFTPDPAQAAGNEEDPDPQAEAAALFEALLGR